MCPIPARVLLTFLALIFFSTGLNCGTLISRASSNGTAVEFDSQAVNSIVWCVCVCAGQGRVTPLPACLQVLNEQIG